MENSTNNCPVCNQPTKSDDQHDAYCENCGFNITKKVDRKQKEA
jgi:predicted amidophosphoribosyltransferase